MDLLSTAPNFRTRQQPVYETMFGGLLSIILLIFFYFFLYQQMMTMLRKLSISYNQGVDDNVHSTSAINSFPFAVAIEGIDLSVTPRKFIIDLLQHEVRSGPGRAPISSTSKVILSKCNFTEWEGYCTHIQHQYKGFGFDRMLCIQKDQNVSIAGYSGSDLFKYLSL